jgi:DNA-binding LytR/AlgR family response regulator
MPKIHIVVTDYAMPGMNGLQLAEAVVERPGTPVVLCTGYAELLGSAQPHLPRISKPFDQAALVASIDARTGSFALGLDIAPEQSLTADGSHRISLSCQDSRHSAGIGLAPSSIAGFFLPNSQVCSRSR